MEFRFFDAVPVGAICMYSLKHCKLYHCPGAKGNDFSLPNLSKCIFIVYSNSRDEWLIHGKLKSIASFFDDPPSQVYSSKLMHKQN